jgi:hypothetical protein
MRLAQTKAARDFGSIRIVAAPQYPRPCLRERKDEHLINALTRPRSASM